MTRDLRRLCEAAIRGSPKASAPINEFQAEAIVRAVLTEMREPSRSMKRLGSIVEFEGDYPASFTPQESEVAEVFTAMIDHILAEPAKA